MCICFKKIQNKTIKIQNAEQDEEWLNNLQQESQVGSWCCVCLRQCQLRLQHPCRNSCNDFTLNKYQTQHFKIIANDTLSTSKARFKKAVLLIVALSFNIKRNEPIQGRGVLHRDCTTFQQTASNTAATAATSDRSYRTIPRTEDRE